MTSRAVFFVPLLMVCPGCFTAQYDVGKPRAEQLAPAASASVTEPADGADERPETYKGSGAQTADALRDVLAKRGMASDANAAPVFRFDSHALRVEPTIELWSDRVTEWSGKPDQIKIRMVVTDSGSGETLDDREITATSKWWTFGGDHPQQMLGDLFTKWADAVFAKPKAS